PASRQPRLGGVPDFSSFFPFALDDSQKQFARLRQVPVEVLQKLLAGTPFGRRLAPQPPRQLLQVFRGRRQFIQRTIVDNAQPALDQAQKFVGSAQRGVFLAGQQARRTQSVDGGERVGGAQGRNVAAVL